MFVQRVKEKEAELKEAERDVHKQTAGLDSLPATDLQVRCVLVCVFQLQIRFEQLKRLHAEEKSSLEEKKRLLDEDQSSFGKRRAAAQLLQAQSLTANGKKDKDRKK